MNEITRFDLDMDGSMEPSEHGNWVRYEDAQRTWVGLTEEEMKKTWYEMQNIMGWYSFQEISKAIEDKLRSKNHDC